VKPDSCYLYFFEAARVDRKSGIVIFTFVIMKELYVNQLQPGERITEFFALRKADLLEKDGRFRLSIELGDATGRVKGVMWDATKEHARLYKAGQIVKVRGQVGTYLDQPQIRVERLRPAKEEEYDLGDYFRKSSKTTEELGKLLDAMIERVENSYLRKLLDAVFSDEIRQRYLTAPAAKLLHHDYIGGLADHSLSMAEVIVRLADHYPKLDRDLLICGTLFHDIGKLWEYEVTAAIDYTDAGRLVGHISQGDEFVAARADSIENFPEDLLMHVRHLIVSHQGEREKGSPILPQTPEAVFLHSVDELDANMGTVEKIRERTEDSGWSEYSRIMNRFFFFGRGEADAEADMEDKEEE
jgi:3'-5' exoribonuclease